MVWSLVIVLLLAAGSPPLQACDDGTAVPDPGNNPGLVEDCKVLLTLRDELAGTGSLNWDTGLAITDWEGIHVSGSPSRVTDLDLTDFGLTGEIPAELGQLTQLTYLDLRNNQLTGAIPAELSQLKQLEHLDLKGNQLTGEIPVELGGLAKLQVLDLGENTLNGEIPVELGQLSQLQYLILYNNQLTGEIPAGLGQLSQLWELTLRDNQLTGAIPAELGQLSELGRLRLENTHLTGPIPPELGQLSQLRELYLFNNQLTGPIPSELGQLSRLWWLDLRNNQLTGEIPAELGQLSQLQELNLFNLNELTGQIPPQLGKLSRLQRLDLRNNQLTGPIPPELGQLSQLQELNLFNNQLSGEIPAQLGKLSRLQRLDLRNNQLTGPIPPELGQLSRLQELNLFNNQLTGEIPSELGQLAQLGDLYLHNNQLTGAIPAELGQLTQLQYLTLFNNQLTGEVPAELGQLAQLQYLTLFNNQLSGEIPVELAQLSQLWSLALDHNQLTGPIPSELGQLSQLRWLTLDHNQLTGKIPAQLGQLSQLRSLALDHNQLTGEIPAELGQLSQLRNLFLANNQLTGEIPLELGRLSNLEQFSFRGNRLTGPVPAALSHLPEGPVEEFALDFAHFANGALITSEMVLVNVGTHPIQPALYFYDKGGNLIAAESVVEVLGDLEIQEDGSLSVRTELASLGELTISTHGQGEVVSGSVKVVSDGPIGGVLRFDLPGIGVAGVGTSQPTSDAIFPARRQAGGISTAAALHNLGEAMAVNCRLMSGGVVLEEVEIPLEANGQEARFIEEMFTMTDTSTFVGSVRCSAPDEGRFTGVAVELDAGNHVFTTLPVVPVARTGGGGRVAVLDFAHFANGASITSDLVLVNVGTTPIRPVIYFYDKAGDPIAAESVVEVTGDLAVTEDGALTVQTELEPLGELTTSTHGRGVVVSGSVKVVSDGPIGGVLRFDLPGIGVAGVGTSQPTGDALFPARRQTGGISTAAALHNLGEEAMGVMCRLMSGGVVLEEVEIPLAANGQEAQFIEEMFTATDTSDFVGSVRCTAPDEGQFTGVAVELDAGNRIFTTLPVVAVPERMSQE